ncbi:PREDICTED: small VCP/p97-interacting protein-like [Priapulus caudatus]|uniref:Small VCP/p97-interacting protein-like n=1 Tax=Priapulus caudatus TaxID=37621 RepID=A0ABM1EQB2_PRICU|nr:PREDICTED: small VCP/p97-interacting protein-like [Priapulus caudatus]
MGCCLPCLEGQSEDIGQPDEETRRRQTAEAAERRQKELEGRGVKDPEKLKQKQKRRQEIENKAPQGEGGDMPLKWQV